MNENCGETTQSIHHIRELIKDGDLKNATDELFEFLKSNPKINAAILQSARVSLLLKEVQGGTISYGDKTVTQNQIIESLLSILDEIEKPVIQNKKKKRKALFIYILGVFSLLLLIGIFFFKFRNGDNNWSAETSLVVQNVDFSLDLTKGWEDMEQSQLKINRVSKGEVYSKFKLVKYDKNVKYFAQRLGTTSVFKPEWKSSTHEIKPVEDPDRKCSPEVKHSYVLYFNIENQVSETPFDLDYTITFWNAHNGESGDWQSQYISFPTEKFSFEIIFPKNKPCYGYELWYSKGVDCTTKPIKYDKEIVVETEKDPSGNIKRLVWKIENPNLHWIYSIQWKW